MADIQSTSFSVVMGATASTLKLFSGPDYTIPAGLKEEDCHVFINSSRRQGMGPTSGGGNQQPSDFGVHFFAGTDVINNIVLARSNISLSVNCRVTITIVYVVNPLSLSRFWMRQRGTLTFGSSDTLKAGGPIEGTGTSDAVLDPTRVWVTIAGQSTEATARSRAHRGHFTADFTGGVAEVERGHIGDVAHASYAVVEFGPDWGPVQRLTFDNVDLAGTIWSSGLPDDADTLAIVADLGGTALADITRAFIDPQRRNSTAGNQGNEDHGDVVELTGSDELTIRHSTNVDASTKHHVVWVVPWSGPANATPPIVQRVSEFVAAGAEGAEEGSISRPITPVANLEDACVIGASSSSDGTGAGTPRGNVDLLLSAVGTVTETRSETSRSERRGYQVIEWPTGAPQEHGSRSEPAHVGSMESQPAVSGSKRAESAVGGSAGGQAACPGSKRSQPGLSGSMGSQFSIIR